jgi:3-methylcrotonyl-CoA carboxylase beta subunit
LMYPNSKISVMGGEQAANVLTMIKTEQMERIGTKENKALQEELKRSILEKYEIEGSAYYSTSRLWDDGIIDPLDTRKILAVAISASLNKVFSEPKSGIYRM